MAQRNVSVRLTTQDDASGPITSVGQRLRLLRDVSEDAGRGMGRITNILGDMGREAIGATGPLGRLGEKLLEFGIGGGAVGLIAAGIAAIGLAYRKLTEDARKAREETEKFVASSFAVSEAGKRESARANLEQLVATVRDLQAQLDENATTVNNLGPAFGLSVEKVKQLTEQLRKARLALTGRPGDAVDLGEIVVSGAAPKRGPTEADKATARNLARQREERLAAGGGGNLIGTGGSIQGGGVPDILAGASPELRAQADAAEAAAAGVNHLRDAYQGAGETLLAVGEGLQAINGSLLGSIPGFGAVSKAASKAAGLIAKVEGTVAIAKGSVKIAESIFPFNPAGLASGVQTVAAGTRLAALGGGSGGGGGGSRGGGGGLAPDQAARNQRELAAARAQRPSVTLKRGYVRTDDPDFQDFVLELIRNGGGRDSDLSYTG